MCRVESNHLHWADEAHQSRVLEEIAVLNRLGDAGQLLIYDAACTDIGVTDLGVAHLAVRQTDVQTGCADIGQRDFQRRSGRDSACLRPRSHCPFFSARWPKPSMMIRAVGFFGPSAFLAVLLRVEVFSRPSSLRRACGGLAAGFAASLCLSLVLRPRFRLGRLSAPGDDRIRQNAFLPVQPFCCVGRRSGAVVFLIILVDSLFQK